jgi:hypothetical protein
VEACERRWNNFCRHCEAEDRAGLPELPPLEDWEVEPRPEPVVLARPVRWEVLSEYSAGKWTRVLGPTSRVRAEQWWVLHYRDGGPGMRVQEV